MAQAPALISMDDAIRIALAYNQYLRAQRTTDRSIEGGRDHGITEAESDVQHAGGYDPDLFAANHPVQYANLLGGLSYTVERGGKREKRGEVAKDNTDVSAQNGDRQ